jgi:hypothetical protein
MVWYLAKNDVKAEEEKVKFEKVTGLSSSYDIGTVRR